MDELSPAEPPPPSTSEGKRARLRRQLAERDGARCVWCWCELDPADGEASTVEHLMPASSGGKVALENAVLACPRCNRRRRNRSVIEFARELYAAGTEPDWATLHRALDRLSSYSLEGWRGEQHRQHGRNQRRQVHLLSTRRERAARKQANRAKRKRKRQRRTAARAAAEL